MSWMSWLFVEGEDIGNGIVDFWIDGLDSLDSDLNR